MTTQTTSQAQPKAYNLHTVGMGFVNRLRFVKPEGKGKGYWCVSIGALYGIEDENGRSESSLFDLNVVGKAAKESVQTLQAAFNEGKKIFVEFKAGDSRAEHFQYKKGQRAGQWGSCIKGTLLQLRKAWVNGELVIDTSQQPDQDEVSDESRDDAPSAHQAPTAESVASEATSSTDQPLSWQERLKARPERIVIQKNDPEAMDKIWAINTTGCYQSIPAGRDDCVAFALIKTSANAA